MADADFTLISRIEAKKRDLTRYFTNLPCKHGHICERYCCSDRCEECSRIQQRKLFHRLTPKQKLNRGRKNYKRYVEKHGIEKVREEARRASKKYYLNPDKRKSQLKWRRFYEREHPESRLFRHAKGRAKKRGLPFNLTIDDINIPNVCPVLGIPLKQGKGRPIPNSPTIDRIIPKLGYVKDNIAIISHRANVIKRDSTLKELELLLVWRRKVCN